MLTYVGEDARRLKVVVNEQSGLTKYVRKSDRTLKFEPWEKHVLNTFSVDFDRNKNPLREKPSGRLKSVDYSTIDHFDAVAVRGEWLEVRWTREPGLNNTKSTDSGWIRWKRNGKLLLELFYLC